MLHHRKDKGKSWNIKNEVQMNDSKVQLFLMKISSIVWITRTSSDDHLPKKIRKIIIKNNLKLNESSIIKLLSKQVFSQNFILSQNHYHRV